MEDLRISKNTLVECKTKNESMNVLLIAHHLGCKWADGHSMCSIRHCYEDSSTLYNISNGNIYIGGAKTFYQSEGFKVISYDDFVNIYFDVYVYINRIDEIKAIRMELDDLRETVMKLKNELRKVATRDSDHVA